MVNNPAYGVDISPDGKRWLNRMKNGQKQGTGGGRKGKVISARLSDDVVERLNAYLKGKGITVNEFVQEAVREKVGQREPLQEGLPGENDALQEGLQEMGRVSGDSEG